MGSKSAQRAQKKREKARKKRAGKKHVTRQASSAGFKQASQWPVGDCWATDTYGERGAQVLVAFSRVHESGRVAVAFFDLDLGEDGVRDVTTFGNVTEAQVMGEVGLRGGDDTVIQVDPALAVKLVLTARDIMYSSDTPPKSYADAISLFGDIRAEDSHEDILTGLDDTEEVEAPTGMFHGVKKFLGLV